PRYPHHVSAAITGATATDTVPSSSRYGRSDSGKSRTGPWTVPPAPSILSHRSNPAENGKSLLYGLSIVEGTPGADHSNRCDERSSPAPPRWFSKTNARLASAALPSRDR